MKIIKDMMFVGEDYRVNEGLIEFSSEKLHDQISRIESSAVIAVVGHYGAGKSTSLFNIQKEDANINNRWLQFDAWRYPERKGLWDGLIIELARALGSEKEATRKIDGNKSLIGKWGGVVSEAFSQFGDLLTKVDIDKVQLDSKVAAGAAKVGTKAAEIFGRSPAKRAYELERILADILVSIKEPNIFMIVEDVDRSGPDGIHFLETLNYFIKNNQQVEQSGKKVIVIAPIAKGTYADNKDSFYKCIDVVINYEPEVKSADKFIDYLFTEEALNDMPLTLANGRTKSNLNEFIVELLNNKDYKVNIRMLKAILRQTAHRFTELDSEYSNVSWKAVFVLECLRNIETKRKGTSLLDEAIESRAIVEGTIFSGMLMTIYNPEQPIFTYRYANRRNKEDRLFNPRIKSYRFSKDSQQTTFSVWREDNWGENEGGAYIADYYVK